MKKLLYAGMAGAVGGYGLGALLVWFTGWEDSNSPRALVWRKFREEYVRSGQIDIITLTVEMIEPPDPAKQTTRFGHALPHRPATATDGRGPVRPMNWGDPVERLLRRDHDETYPS